MTALKLQISRRDDGRPSHVWAEDVFKGVLVREQRRADRFKQALLVLHVGIRARDSIEPAVIAALTAAKRDTDVLGWLRQDAVLALIVPDIKRTDATVFRAIEGRVRRELALRLAEDELHSLSIGVRLHAPAQRTRSAGGGPSRTTLIAKRVLDVVGSAALLVVLSPLMTIVAALLKATSKGPVFYKQVRVGQMSRPFTIFKFRTMKVGADHAPHQEYVTRFIKASGDVSQPVPSAPFKIAHDPRITPIGMVLRKTSLDELPQLFNVLRGEMSLVGPRPPLPYEVEQYEPWHRRRLIEAKPGITGLWQVTGRSRTTFDEMVRLDLRYARTCSVWTDLKILCATPAAVISGRGAA